MMNAVGTECVTPGLPGIFDCLMSVKCNVWLAGVIPADLCLHCKGRPIYHNNYSYFHIYNMKAKL